MKTSIQTLIGFIILIQIQVHQGSDDLSNNLGGLIPIDEIDFDAVDAVGKIPTNLKIEYVSKEALHLGEGPFWDEKTCSLFLVNTFIGDVIQLNVSTGCMKKFNLGDYVSIVIPVHNHQNKFIVSRRNQLVELDWSNKTYVPFADVGVEKFNDGKVDALGRLWIGTLRNFIHESNEGAIRNGGALYRLDGRKLTRITTMSLPNGMAWSLDNRKYYIADTIERQIYVYDFELISGKIFNKRILLDFNNNPQFNTWELPDGMAMDRYGKLWCAVIFGARLIQIDTITGRILRSITTPANQTTSIAFGGKDYNDMYVTTGNRDLTHLQKILHPNVGRQLQLTAKYIGGPGPAYRVKF